LRAQRPNLGTLLVAACAVVEEAMRAKNVNLIVMLDREEAVEIERDDTHACVAGRTFIESLIYFADGLHE
jgi:hypothetical protein